MYVSVCHNNKENEDIDLRGRERWTVARWGWRGEREKKSYAILFKLETFFKNKNKMINTHTYVTFRPCEVRKVLSIFLNFLSL